MGHKVGDIARFAVIAPNSGVWYTYAAVYAAGMWYTTATTRNGQVPQKLTTRELYELLSREDVRAQYATEYVDAREDGTKP